MKTSFSMFFVVLLLLLTNNSFSQGQFFSDRKLGPAPQSDIPPEFQNARNVAISSRISTPGAYCNGFEPVRALNYPSQNDTTYFVIVPYQIATNRFGYAFYNVNNPNYPTFFGKIIINNSCYAKWLKKRELLFRL